MRLREHPKIEWPLSWGEGSLSGEKGILRDVDLIEPMKLLISNEIDGKVYFAEIDCSNSAFASRLHEKIRAIVRETDKRSGRTRFLDNSNSKGGES